jgi:hypothetical protein
MFLNNTFSQQDILIKNIKNIKKSKDNDFKNYFIIINKIIEHNKENLIDRIHSLIVNFKFNSFITATFRNRELLEINKYFKISTKYIINVSRYKNNSKNRDAIIKNLTDKGYNLKYMQII